MSARRSGIATVYEDVWLIGGVRTGFAEYNGVLGAVSPIDLGIKVARETFSRTGVPPEDVGTVIAGSMAQARRWPGYVRPSAACRPGATARASTARRRCWSLPETTRASGR